MCKKLMWLISLVLVLGLAATRPTSAAEPGLVGWWCLDEGSGTVAKDSSGGGHDGAVRGAQWTAGRIGKALLFDEVNDSVLVTDFTYGPEFTIAFWFKVTENSGPYYQYMFSHGNFDVAHSVNIYICEDGEASGLGGVLRTAFRDTNDASNSGAFDIPKGLADGNWHHYALTVGTAAGATVYIDGVRRMSAARGGGTFNPTTNMVFGARVDLNADRFLGGNMDDIRLYNRTLTAVEVQTVITSQAGLATDPSPAGNATDVPVDTALAWKPAESAGKHNVYLGTESAAVANAEVAVPLGVLVGTGQTAATYQPAAPLAYGRTYYWRVDEVNAVSQEVTKGDVWSFTVEPYAYPLKNVTATASSVQPGMGPEKTVDGSGLNANDQHSTELKDMWLSGGTQPNWIQFTFDQVYKLHELWIWNSNQLIESILGFGAKTVTIEHSVDGSTWTALAGVPEFAKATGAAAYAHGTTVSLGGVSAKYVRLTINSTWSGVPQASLSEVRFFYVPVQARQPAPVNAATGVELDTALSWRPGRGAASHKVYVGTDKDAVVNGTAPAKTVSERSFSPASLDFGTTYYWKVDEVNAVTYPGEVWSFTTREYAVVDDFERYTDKEGNAIFDTWIDGYANGLSGSIVGYAQAANGTFGETRIIHGGKQSMPLEYNNVKTPYYSEAEQQFSPAQDWTVKGATDVSIWYQGRPVAFLDKGDGAFTISGAGHDIWDNADDFRFAYKRLTGNASITVKLESIGNTNAWAKGGVMIRDSLDPGAKYAYVVSTPAQGVSFGWRLNTAAACGSATQAGLPTAQWVKLTRTGDAFTAQYSADGKTWADIKNADGTATSTTILMSGSIYIGLCVTSHNAAATTTAQFSGAATTGNVTGPWQVAAIGDDSQAANSPEGLYAIVQDSAGKSKVVNHPNPTATALSGWQQWRIPLSEFTAAGVKMTAVKKLIIGAGDRNAPKAGGAGLLYIDDVGFGHPAQ